MPELEVTSIDLVVVGIYFVLTIGLGIWVGRGASDTSGYFLGGRNFVWPFIGLSLFATNQSGTSLVGLAASGYSSGIAVFNYEWTGALSIVILMVFFLPFYLRTGLYTTPEYLEKRYDRRARYIFSAYLVITIAFLAISAALYAGGLALQTLFPGLPLWITIAIIGALAGLYTVVGGLAAVIVTDTVQAVVLIVGSAFIAFFVFQEVGSLDAVREAAGPEALRLIQPADDPSLPWPGMLTGLMVLNLYFFCMNQSIVQRTLAARDLSHGQRGALFGASLKLLLLFLLILPATAAIVLYPDISNPDLVFPTLAFDLLPVGVRGIVLAALIAAIMSSVDSQLNAASTVITMDFVKTLRPETSEARLVTIGKFSTFGLMLFALIWAPQIQHFETLWGYIQSVGSYFTPSIVAAFVIGLFWRRANAHGAFWTLVILLPIGIAGFIVTEVAGLISFQFLYAAGILFGLACLLLVGISLATDAPPADKVDGLVWRRAMWREESAELNEVPWYRNYRYWSVALFVLVAIIVIPFW